MYNNEERKKTCVLMGFFKTNVSEEEITYKMDEFHALAEAALLEVCRKTIQRRDKIEAPTYIGTGKVEELRYICEEENADMLIINVELSGAQIKNLSDLTNVEVIDRTALILDIFARRASSSVAKLQVELAQYKYLMPRLKGFRKDLSNTGAGIGTRGPGEQKLELDRRKISDKIFDYQLRLKEAEEKRQVTKKNRQKSGIKTVSLLGYTNAGKSSLMNLFVEKYPGDAEEQSVFVKNMLFATLETYHRRINLENKKSFVLSDTVGFVSDLPHDLVKAFSSTLEEVKDADLILHVVDISNDEYKNQMDTSNNILDELGADEENRIIVFNKADLIELSKEKVNNSKNIFYLSCKTGEGFIQLKEEIEKRLFGETRITKFLIPYSEGSLAQDLMDSSEILKQEYVEEGTLFEVELSLSLMGKFIKYEYNN